ncbi:GNAT family N-acetyltransferase [Rhizobium indigoferae]|uniref:GNAT family N-acetyltransferase n=2 Tax=Rhizobium indigoferae TaxID=158891 RepID=A0ABZ1DRG4_9HYPH|nr:GNAT family N-acetyltransferase [Rhizobium indigoferae]WRW38493.1 GNAT family N-acetyltransferase [Rhizobium indigoferae]
MTRLSQPIGAGQGIGRLLLDAAMETLQARGSERFVLSTAFQNEAARSLFTSMGFRPAMVEMIREADAHGLTP